jgi:hypothetical protein
MESYLDIAERMPQYREAEKLTLILEAIARCKTRIRNRIDFCKVWHGLTGDGTPQGAKDDLDYINKYRAIEQRLKLYYNNKVAKLSTFKLHINEQSTATNA